MLAASSIGELNYTLKWYLTIKSYKTNDDVETI